MNELTDDDLDVIAETGERLPLEMFDPALLELTDDPKLPVFVGEGAGEQRGE
jgi:hypothetical protein